MDGVLLHSYDMSSVDHGVIVYESGFYNIVQVLFSQGICRVAVPMFYFISGYLFYNELKEWNWEVYGRKLKSRVSTILIPYCIWNIIGWFLLCLNHSFFKGDSSIWMSMTPWDILWSNDNGWPAVIPLWFIRDLIVVILWAYLIYLFIKYLKTMGILLLVLLYVSDSWISYPGFSPESTLFFALGCYMQITDKDPLKVSNFLGWISGIVFCIMLILRLITWNRCPIDVSIQNILTIMGVILVLKLGSFIDTTKHRNIYDAFSKASFFVFATHLIYILPAFRGIFNVLLPLDSQYMRVVGYFGCAVFTYFTCVIIYRLLYKLAPRLTSVLVGQR